jgi:hypothetical protein
MFGKSNGAEQPEIETAQGPQIPMGLQILMKQIGIDPMMIFAQFTAIAGRVEQSEQEFRNRLEGIRVWAGKVDQWLPLKHDELVRLIANHAQQAQADRDRMREEYREMHRQTMTMLEGLAQCLKAQNKPRRK